MDNLTALGILFQAAKVEEHSQVVNAAQQLQKALTPKDEKGKNN